MGKIIVGIHTIAARADKELIDEEGTPKLKLRVLVQGGGSTGFQNAFTYEETTNDAAD